jgi:hypothetical protein
MELWMFFTTAITFTGMGWFMRSDDLTFKQSKENTKQVIDTLIAMGYVKVVGSGDQAEMIRWPEDDDIIFLEEEEENDT